MSAELPFYLNRRSRISILEKFSIVTMLFAFLESHCLKLSKEPPGFQFVFVRPLPISRFLGLWKPISARFLMHFSVYFISSFSQIVSNLSTGPVTIPRGLFGSEGLSPYLSEMGSVKIMGSAP